MQLFGSALRPLKSTLDKNLTELIHLGLDSYDLRLQTAAMRMAVDFELLLSSEKAAHQVKRVPLLNSLIDAMNYIVGQLMICIDEGT